MAFLPANQQGFADEQEARKNRINFQLQHPDLPQVSNGNDDAWDAFFGGLHKNAGIAHAMGFGYNASPALAALGPNPGMGDPSLADSMAALRASARMKFGSGSLG